jgi:hypothetical protein
MAKFTARYVRQHTINAAGQGKVADPHKKKVKLRQAC